MVEVPICANPSVLTPISAANTAMHRGILIVGSWYPLDSIRKFDIEIDAIIILSRTAVKGCTEFSRLRPITESRVVPEPLGPVYSNPGEIRMLRVDQPV